MRAGGRLSRAHGVAAGPVAAIASLMLLSVLLRTGVFDGVGEYSDIVHLYRRDGLRSHPAPYLDYPLEYPVLIGAFQWVVGFIRTSAGLFFVASAAVLGSMAVVTVCLLTQVRGANPWILAAAPAVMFWGVQNWDFVGILPLVAALVLYERGRDGWGTAALAVAVSAKLFPIVVLPVVLAVRIAEGRHRAVGVIMAVFVLVTFVLNAPVALQAVGHGVALRPEWTHFFEFSHNRPPENTLWPDLAVMVSEVNQVSGLLLALGTAGLVGLTVRCTRRGQHVLVPAASAALLWLFATNKVYSAQYALWIMAALALAAVPVPAAVAFAAVDIMFFVTLWGGLPGLGDLPDYLRQIGTAALAVCIAVQMLDHLTDVRLRQS